MKIFSKILNFFRKDSENVFSILPTNVNPHFIKLKKLLSKIKVVDVVIFMTIFCVFLSPTYFFIDNFNLDVTKYVFFIFSFFMYCIIILRTEKIYAIEKVFILLVLIICIAQKSIVPLSLLELLLLYRTIDMIVDCQEIDSKKNLVLCSVGVIIYSIAYFEFNNRYIYTGLREINQSGFAIFMLAILIRKNNLKLGNIVFALGLLTFSRNYLLAVMVYIILEFIKPRKLYDKIYKFFSFKMMMILSVLALVLISMIFEIAYQNEKLVEYKEGLARYVYIFDYSNYFRFSTNTNLLKMYVEHPQKLLTGIDEKEFFEYSREIANKNDRKYRAIKPHNYFFSYLRIYGIFSIVTFLLVDRLITKVVNKNNFSILAALFVYATLLGIGFTNYWMFLSIMTLSIYIGKDEQNEFDNNYKNVSKKKCVE